MFNLLRQWLNKKKEIVQILDEKEKLSMEIVKAYVKICNSMRNNGVDSYKKIFSLRHNLSNGKTLSFEVAQMWGYSPSDALSDGEILCKFDNNLYVCVCFTHNGQWKTNSPTDNSKFKYCYGRYNNSPDYKLTFEEYKPYMQNILEFLNSKYDEFKKEKDDEFQKFRKAL